MFARGSSHQLVEFLTAVSGHEQGREATAVAAELAAEQFNAEIGAIIVGNEVSAAVGFGGDAVPVEQLCRARPGQRTIELPRVGTCDVAVANWEGSGQGRVIVVRLDAPFRPEERNLLMGMARVLGLSLRHIAALQTERRLRTERGRQADERLVLLSSLRERQQLLEVLLDIQHSISHRAPLRDVLSEVTAGASALLGNCAVSLILDDALDPARPIVASTTPDPARGQDRVVVIAAAGTARSREPPHAGTLVATVHVSGKPAGALVAISGDGAPSDQRRRRMLDAFAEHASLALTDARTVEAMREAFHDPLTALPNRALFVDRLQHVLDGASVHGNAVAVLFIDLDRFKAVNDTLGHAAGDELLRKVAERLLKCTRSSDTTARFGGDEFAALLQDGAAGRRAERAAERIIAAIRRPFRIGRRDVFVGATIGIAHACQDTTVAHELLGNADLAMYCAKKAGGGRLATYLPEMRSALIERVELEADLQHALARGELSVEYQPLIDLATQQPIGVEALARWTHPTRGPIPPATFIPIAEETGAISEVGRWILDESARQVTLWRQLTPELTLNVNLSARQLEDDDLVAHVEQALGSSGLPGSALTLEITESVLAAGQSAVARKLQRLRELGVSIAVDDFGIGYSLGHLQEFAINVVKIDKSFINAIESGSEDSSVAAVILQLASTMRLQTIAEGIERADQLTALRALRCNTGQGFLFTTPLACEAMTGYLRTCSGLTTQSSEGRHAAIVASPPAR
jgi:diguanylate cyclase (GGDEF)-like protein